MLSPFSWCVVTSEGRQDGHPSLHDYILGVAAVNYAYAQRHGYGFRFARPSENRCPHPRLGRRAAAWCKVPVVADVILNGLDGRRCESVLYVDSDAMISNPSLSIDEWLARARRRGDDALRADGEWLLLLSSDYWFSPDEPNTGVWLGRAGESAGRRVCGILRRWWDARFPTNNMNRPWEQAAMRAMCVVAAARGSLTTADGR